MEGPRAPDAGEWPEVLTFLNQHLRPDYKWSIAAEYPLAIHPGNRGNVRIIKESGELLAHALLKVMIIKTPFGLFKAGAIGSVVTAEAHRGKGLSHSILQECLSLAKAQGCDFAILWTQLYDFYRKIGFELLGSEVSLVIDRELEKLPKSNLRFLESSQVAPEALLRLYSHHTVGSIRSVEDIRKNLTIPNTRVFTAWDEYQNLQAYAIEGKGADLKGYIHEWGGGVSKLLPLLAFVRETLKQPITLIAPSHSQNLIKQLKTLGAFEHEGFLGMIQILNPANITAKVERYVRAKGISDFAIACADDGSVTVQSGENTLNLSNMQQFARLVFGPLEDAPKASWAELLPIPMWLWGWDSV